MSDSDRQSQHPASHPYIHEKFRDIYKIQDRIALYCNEHREANIERAGTCKANLYFPHNQSASRKEIDFETSRSDLNSVAGICYSDTSFEANGGV